MTMKILNTVMLLLFLLSVAVQYNDPDGWLWMFIYGYYAAVTAFAITDRYTLLAPIGAVAGFAGFAYQMPGWDWDTLVLLTRPKMDSLDVELAREAFGVLICAVWMGVLTVVDYRRRKAAGANVKAPAEEP